MIRNKKFEVCVSERAELEIADWRVEPSVLPVIATSLRVSLAKKDPPDVCEGTLRYRDFRNYVVTFHITESQDAVRATILHIWPADKVSASDAVLAALKENSALLSAAVKVGAAVVGGS